MGNELLVPNVPQPGGGVTRASDEIPLVRGHTDAHDVTAVPVEEGLEFAGGDVPQGGSRVSRGGHDVSVVYELATRDVPCVRYQFLKRKNLDEERLY